MSSREEAMRQWEIWTCPPWCTRNDDPNEGEHQYEEHFSEWERLDLSNDGTYRQAVEVRTRKSWFDGSAGEEEFHVELRIVATATQGELYLTAADLDLLEAALSTARERGEDWDAGDWVESYDGAEADSEGVDEDEDDEAA